MGNPWPGGAPPQCRRGRDPAVGRRSRHGDAGSCGRHRQGEPRSWSDALCGDHRSAGLACGDRRTSRPPHGPGGGGRPRRRARRRPVGIVRRLPVPARAWRRGAGAGAHVCHLPGDGRGRRGTAGAGAAGGGARLPPRSRRPGLGRNRAHPGDPDQLAAQPDRRGDDAPRDRDRGPALPAARPVADLRRGLCDDALRRRARGARRPARHGCSARSPCRASPSRMR